MKKSNKEVKEEVENHFKEVILCHRQIYADQMKNAGLLLQSIQEICPKYLYNKILKRHYELMEVFSIGIPIDPILRDNSIYEQTLTGLSKPCEVTRQTIGIISS